ncbi:hypothetical protein [Kribbella turkmenica]|uniref:hypothetical protein n=1 Tax=Kribbella turkmenica TaxID=2530375 RepID=UPI001405105B|nr:hypothetical protein [Kribbella turkmenica]
MSATVPPSRAARSRSDSRAVSAGPGDQRLRGQRQVDDARALVHRRDGVSQLSRRRVLHD